MTLVNQTDCPMPVQNRRVIEVLVIFCNVTSFFLIFC